jgi:hypothetical protein
MGPKAPKKSKEEIAAEKAAAEAEAARLAEIERKKAEALAEKQRLEAEKLQEERVAARKLEIERISIEHTVYSDELQKRIERKAKFIEEELARSDWEKFRNPSDQPDSSNEKDMNTFITLTNNNDVAEMNDVLKVVTGVEEVANTVEEVWAQSLAERDIKNLQITNDYLQSFSSSIASKMDSATSQYLRFVENNLNDRSEVQVEEVADRAALCLWGSFSDIRPIRKSIQFETMGVQLDVPKQILQQNIMIHRCIRMPIDHSSTQIYSDPGGTGMKSQVLGDLYKFDILIPPQQAFEIRAKKWVIRNKSSAATKLQKIAYPSTIGMRCFIKVPDSVIMGADVRIMVYDEEATCSPYWIEDGITDFQYSEETRLCQFMLTTMGTLAFVKERSMDFPYKKWSLTPLRTLSSSSQNNFFEQEACYTLQTARYEIVINIRGNQVCLATCFDPSCKDLVGVNMPPGLLLSKLQKRGINVLPHQSDFKNVEGLGDAKRLALEDDVLSEMARGASAFDYSSSTWNKQINEQRVGLLVRESSVYTARGETYDYECILVEEDIVTELNTYAPDVGIITGVGSSNCVFKNVLGNQYGIRPGFSHGLRPGEISHIELIPTMERRCTTECIERAKRTNELFQDTVFKILQLTRPLSMTFQEEANK